MRNLQDEHPSFPITRRTKDKQDVKAAQPTSGRERRGSILLVDDDRVVLSCLEALLDKHFHITAVQSFAAARTTLERHNFDVVLADYELEDATGLVLLDLVQSKFAATVGILLTGHAKHPLVQQAQANGHGLRVLLKPYDPDTLLSALKTAVSIATMRSATQRLASRQA